MVRVSAQDIELLVRLLRHDDEAVARLLAARRAPLASFVDVVASHGLSVVLLRALGGSPSAAAFSPAEIERLEAARRRQTERSHRLLGAMERLAERFAAAEQPFLLLKGPYLAERYYGDPQGREFVDLDLLVPRADRDQVCRLLGDEGYAPKSRTLLGPRLTSFFVHGFDFSDGSAQVDLHWFLSRHPSLRLDEAALWRRRQSWLVGGQHYDVLGDEDEVVFATVSLLRDLERGRPKIKNVVDLLQIAQALDERFDWDTLLASRRREGIHGPLVNVLGLCLDLAAAHDLAPRLSTALAAHASRRVPAHAADSPLVFRPAALNLGTRLWCARAYDAPPALSLLWWGVSLPFRIAAHRRPKRRGA